MLYRILATVFFVPAALAQDETNQPDTRAFFPKPSYFRQTFFTRTPKVELRPPVRIADFVVDGKLELSLRSYLELVMANNTDVQITRLSVETAKNAIVRAYASFDPTAFASFSSTRTNSPTTEVLQGAQTLSTLNQPYNFSYQQRLESGTLYTVGFSGAKSATNSQFATFNPSITSNLNVSFQQPLLRNRGTYINRLPISVARSNLRLSEYQLRDRLMTLLTDAENAYWDLVLAREDLKVQEKGLELRDQALKRAQRELELGAIPQLDIYQPQAEYASAEIQVSQARYRLLQSEDRLRRQIGADLDPDYRKIPIVPAESVAPSTDTAPIDAEAAVERALARRPDLKVAIQRLDVDDLTIKQAANLLRPILTLTGNYTSQGRGGTFLERQNVFGQSSTLRTVPGGLGDAFDQLFGFNFPVYTFGLTLNLPIKNRSAAADMADAVVRKRQDTLTVRSTEQAIRLDVLNAVNQVESSKASVKLAQVFRDLAQKQLEAELKKYELGTSQLYFVLQFGQTLINAENTLLQQSIGYRRSLLNLLRRTGELLEERGVVVQ